MPYTARVRQRASSSHWFVLAVAAALLLNQVLPDPIAVPTDQPAALRPVPAASLNWAVPAESDTIPLPPLDQPFALVHPLLTVVRWHVTAPPPRKLERLPLPAHALRGPPVSPIR
ncbi:MAG: hypothetical protein K6U89_05930 [Chloroflexi bacterium]|nr:hypothetical protein [Chloroflexota bacterium]